MEKEICLDCGGDVRRVKNTGYPYIDAMGGLSECPSRCEGKNFSFVNTDPTNQPIEEKETTFCTHLGYNTVAPCGKDCPMNQPIEEKWKIEKRALDLVCSIFYYGQFKAETPNEKELESILKELGRWPTSESVCVQNTKWWEGQKSFIENLLEQEKRRVSEEISKNKVYDDGDTHRTPVNWHGLNDGLDIALSIINK